MLCCDCRVTIDIEPLSVDEMLVDVTSILKDVPNASPENLAVFLRKLIYVCESLK